MKSTDAIATVLSRIATLNVLVRSPFSHGCTAGLAASDIVSDIALEKAANNSELSLPAAKFERVKRQNQKKLVKAGERRRANAYCF